MPSKFRVVAALAVTLPWTLAPEDLFARETLESFKV